MPHVAQMIMPPSSHKMLRSTRHHQNRPVARGKRSRPSLDEDVTTPSRKRQKLIDLDSRPNLPAPSRGTKVLTKAAAAANGFEEVKQAMKLSLVTTNDETPNSTTRPVKRVRVALPVENDVSKPASSQSSSQSTLVDDKRKLRSQDGTSRLRSDLSLYFPAFDEMISVEPKETDSLTTDAQLWISDAALLNGSTPRMQAATTGPYRGRPRNSTLISRRAPLIGGSSPFVSDDNHFLKINAATKIDFSFMASAARQVTVDPLADDVYYKAHRRAERQEKQLRNIEKERAQHEKYHLEHLLQGLKGHDWLRTMGITGITESEKKVYEPKRDLFIREVTALIEKFRVWKEEEKRRKMHRDAAVRANSKATSEDEEEAVLPAQNLRQKAQQGLKLATDLMPGNPRLPGRKRKQKLLSLRVVDGNLSDGDPPDYTDVDADAARQLHEEAIRATSSSQQLLSTSPSNLKLVRSKHSTKGSINGSVHLSPPDPPKPFTSFFEKPYQRAAAVGNQRRSARSASAFGKPIPDIPIEEFALPSDLLTEEAKIASARARRRSKRESKDGKV